MFFFAIGAHICLSWGPVFCLTVPRTFWSECTQSEQSPLACSKIPLECLFRTVDIYNLMRICCIFCISTRFSFLPFVQLNLQFKCSFQFIFQFNTFVQSMFDYCPIIVQLLFNILILEIIPDFRSRCQQPCTKSINITQVQDLPTFVLA
jgi:hypothetical protein